MASKTFEHPVLGRITIYKRRGSQKVSMRLQSGHIKVTQPFWLPFTQGIKFVEKNAGWIENQRKATVFQVKQGEKIGKSHRVEFMYGESLSARVSRNVISVTIPFGSNPNDEEVQNKTRRAIKNALTKEAKEVLIPRLAKMAEAYGFRFRAVAIKSMRTRWGSCTNAANISLNCYLMMASWDLIDYVLLHELVHTRHLHHGKEFWDTVEMYMPDYKVRRKAIREQQHTLMAFR